MLNKKDGVSLIELLIVMALIVIVLAMTTETLPIIFRQSRQQAQVVSAQMEGIIGLDILRSDIEHAGYGLPWSFQPGTSISYSEASTSPADNYNDSSNGVPRAILSGNDTIFGSGYISGSDYLVIKSPIVATNDTATKWTHIITGQGLKHWGSNDFTNAERVIVIRPSVSDAVSKELVINSADNSFFTTGAYSALPAAFSPTMPSEMFLIYGIDPNTNLIMPFNRADYYVTRPSTNMPSNCAPGTGILYKATVNQADGGLNEMPLIDCVADMQVIFGLDTTGSGTVGTRMNDITALTAQQIREQVKEVRVYILTHEGESDKYYTYPNNVITVGEFGLGRNFDLSANIGTGWQNYRWKLYTMVVKPKNLYK
jgi:prepilin-type N-terminal cleavage/methylation domain-containing protein